MDKPSIYDFLDYSEYLKAFYEHKKSVNPRFSHRLIAGKLGCNPSYYLKVMQGTRELSMTMLFKIADFVGMTKRETDYFESLVQLKKAKTAREKKHYFEKVIAQRSTKIKMLEKAQYEFYSKWYYVAVLEVLDYYAFSGDYERLAAMMTPPIKPTEARKAIQTLESLGLIVKTPDGLYQKVDKVISVGDDWQSMVIANFLLETMDLAKDAVMLIPRERREVGAQTLSISEATFNRIRDKLRGLRKEVLELARADEHADRVYQLNLQAFPLTKPLGETSDA
jgi:uncharacterized protein (TIGR02147 family)